MFRLHIASYAALHDSITTFAPTHIISLMERVEALPEPHLHVAISDVVKPTGGAVQPTMRHLDRVFVFTAGLGEDDRLLVHCYAGESRSTAVAIAVLLQHGLPHTAALACVARLRPVVTPNRLLIHLIDHHFNLHGALERGTRQHMRYSK